MNNDFYRNRGFALRGFFGRKRIVLALLIAVVLSVSCGLSVFFIKNARSDMAESTPPVSDIPDGNAQVSKPETPVPDGNIQNDPKPEEGKDPGDEIYYRRPVDAEIGIGFSGTTPVFSETLNDWRLHQGVDYMTGVLETVYAASDGLVEDVYDDGLMGITVVILHPDGIRTVYQSLNDAAVIKGAEVFGGDVVGHAGITADAECASGVHLHFAVLKNGVYIDPEELFAD